MLIENKIYIIDTTNDYQISMNKFIARCREKSSFIYPYLLTCRFFPSQNIHIACGLACRLHQHLVIHTWCPISIIFLRGWAIQVSNFVCKVCIFLKNTHLKTRATHITRGREKSRSCFFSLTLYSIQGQRKTEISFFL